MDYHLDRIYRHDDPERDYAQFSKQIYKLRKQQVISDWVFSWFSGMLLVGAALLLALSLLS